MAKKDTSKEVQTEEEICEGCDEYTDKKTMKEAAKASKAKRYAVQDEYDAEEEDEKEEMKEEEEEGDEEEMNEEEEEEGDEKEMNEAADEEDDAEEGEEEEAADEEGDEEGDDEEEDEDEEDEEGEMKESFNSLFSGTDLSEDFKLKAETLFEAAVNERVQAIEEQLANKFTDLLESEVKTIATDLTEKVDSYLNYIVSEWLEENKLAVENGIRTEIAESFIGGLRGLFMEHNIAVPEGETDLLEETASNLARVTEELNRQMQKTVDLTEKLGAYQRAEIFAEATEGLSESQIEKLRNLAENMDYDTNDEFKAKIGVLKENYTKTSSERPVVSSVQIEEAGETDTLTEETESSVTAYINALTRKIK